MLSLFKIDFEVDNGTSYEKDVAIVLAAGLDDAENSLKKFINTIDSETYVSRIFSVSLFTGNIFTGRHGFKE